MTTDPAIAALRARRDLSASVLDEDTRFVVEVLKLLRSERASKRLVEGHAISFVRFDFRSPRAAALGPKVDLRNGGAVAGALYVCNDVLGVAHRWPGRHVLSAIPGHADALADFQMETKTSIIFEPSRRLLEIRMECLPEAVLQLTLADGLDPDFSRVGLTSLNEWIDRFHASVDQGELLHRDGRLRSDSGVLYRNAMYLYLTYQLGLTEASGFRVSVEKSTSFVRIRQIVGGSTAVVVGIRSRSSRAGALARWLDRSGGRLEHEPTYVSCLACSSDVDPSKECGTLPVSIRHRHVATI